MAHVSDESGLSSIFVTNLNRTVEERDLEKLFGKFGAVLKTKIVKDPETGFNVKSIFKLANFLPSLATSDICRSLDL